MASTRELLRAARPQRKKRAYFAPIPTESLSEEERDDLIAHGWRVFVLNGIEFIVPRRGVRYAPPSLTAQIPVPRLPRATYGVDPDTGQHFDLLAIDYSRTTVQDIDGPLVSPQRYRRIPLSLRDGYIVAPRSLRETPRAIGYVWTDRGLQVIQEGRQDLLPAHDPDYERLSREQRGWYGLRTRAKGSFTVTEGTPRTLVTTSEELAEAWLLAGGKVRLVRDLVRSYGVSLKRRGL